MIHLVRQQTIGNVRIGIVGAGAHARENLIPAIRETEDMRIVAVSSRCLDSARDLAARYDASYYSDDWMRMLDNEIVDALVVSAPPDVHAQVASACLERGIHVFVEKPPAPDLDSLRSLAVTELGARGTVAFVDYNFRYADPVAKALVAIGGNNAVQCAKIRFISSKPTECMWHCTSVLESFLLAVGIHAIDMALHLFGKPLDIKFGHCQLSAARFVFTVLLEFAGGRTAILELGNYSNRFEFCCEFISQTGVVAVINQHNQLSFAGTDWVNQGLSAFKNKQTVEFLWPSLQGGFARTGYRRALESFSDSIRSGSPSDSSLCASVPCFEVINALAGKVALGDSSRELVTTDHSDLNINKGSKRE